MTSLHPEKGPDPVRRRNEATRRSVIVAAGLALLARPANAVAGQPVADRTADTLIALAARELAAAAGYREAGGGLFERLAGNCEAHVGALGSQLDSVGRKPPAPPPAADVGDGIALERKFVASYRAALDDLYDPATKRTAATIMAGHAQHLVVLLENPLGSLGERA